MTVRVQLGQQLEVGLLRFRRDRFCHPWHGLMSDVAGRGQALNRVGKRRSHRIAGAVRFAALDFELANRRLSSVCAIGIVRVEDGCLVQGLWQLVRPPTGPFSFSGLHGLTAADVRAAPGFADAWASVRAMLADAEFVAAHNAAFERRVLRACSKRWGLPASEMPWECTMAWVRTIWNPPRLGLAAVTGMLGIPLVHHDPLSDARACARIVLRVQEVLRRPGGPVRWVGREREEVRS